MLPPLSPLVVRSALSKEQVDKIKSCNSLLRTSQNLTALGEETRLQSMNYKVPHVGPASSCGCRGRLGGVVSAQASSCPRYPWALVTYTALRPPNAPVSLIFMLLHDLSSLWNTISHLLTW